MKKQIKKQEVRSSEKTYSSMVQAGPSIKAAGKKKKK
jgi:hypothetical protein